MTRIYKGKDINTLTKEELLEIINYFYDWMGIDVQEEPEIVSDDRILS